MKVADANHEMGMLWGNFGLSDHFDMSRWLRKSATNSFVLLWWNFVCDKTRKVHNNVLSEVLVEVADMEHKSLRTLSQSWRNAILALCYM